MVDLRNAEDMKFIQSQLSNNLWNTQMIDIIRLQKALPFDNAVLPSLIEGAEVTKNGCRIKTIEKISPISYEGYGDNKVKIQMPEYLRVYFIFDWENNIKKECFSGECDLNRMDSLAAVSISLPGRNNAKVDWFMEMSNPAYKHIKNIRNYTPKSSSGSTMDRRVEVNFHLEFVTYDDMTKHYPDTEQYFKRLPSKITDFLSEENLCGHYERKKVTEMTMVDGRNIPSTTYKPQRIPGILENIKTPVEYDL